MNIPTTSTPNTKSKTKLCNECGKRIHHSNIDRHLKTHDSNTVKCKKCSAVFKDNDDLQRHMVNHTDIIHVCDHCPKTYKRKSALMEHIRGKHENIVKKFKCHICDKDFTRLGHLQNHLNFHSRRKPFACEGCKHKFTSKAGLTFHKKSCTGHEKFICKTCHNRYSSSLTLKEHVAGAHTGKRYSCVCGAIYKWRPNLHSHQKVCTHLKQ